ncbi:glycosyltransferase family 4 protein [Desulfotignum phosphitoxidans]|uniref:Putative glycosyltransferase n=1 Tax=Desulfotignum phosphitoxidans DSM 13687 TaxID=1286635 RepID=S0G5N5_9BACT|nr:glycosyltransferase family 4 protein [Desulfotignum phosphitoxidans]EMS79566.1 putative glycosyltransferase [Desulfotignum phosphitoxidans DSM 13687]
MNSTLKIALLSYRSNPHCGGQGVYIRHLSRALSDLGHQVEVIAGPPDPQLNGHAGLTMLRTLDLYNPNDLFRTPSISELSDWINLMEWLDVCTMGYPEPWTFGKRVVRHLKGRESRYDIIHDNQSLSYGLLSLMKKVPVTATIHHPMTVDRRLAVKATRSFYKKIKALRWYSFIHMQKKVARKLPRILTVSTVSKQDISKEFSIPENRFSIIPNGIDTASFHPLETVKKINNRIIVTNSADTPLKGLYHLLYAVKNIVKKRRVSLVVIGSPKKNGGVERLIRQLDLAPYIEFTGRISQTRFCLEYAKATMAVVPSLYEGFGLPVGEAMACRIPVICTTGGALPEVAGDAAELVPPGDSAALETAILKLLDDPARREILAQKGYDRVMAHFTWEATAQKTVKAYRDIIHDYH